MTFTYEDYEFDIPDDYVHKDELEKYKDAEYWIKEMILQAYFEGNLTLFEDAFEELSAVFDINIPSTPIKFHKKEKPKSFCSTNLLLQGEKNVSKLSRRKRPAIK